MKEVVCIWTKILRRIKSPVTILEAQRYLIGRQQRMSLCRDSLPVSIEHLLVSLLARFVAPVPKMPSHNLIAVPGGFLFANVSALADAMNFPVHNQVILE